MISIFILYSDDRLEQFSQFSFCLQEMENYKKCQKILCVDGNTNLELEDYEIIKVPRPSHGYYCWANMWEKSIDKCIFEKIIYLDCDRVLNKNYLNILEKNIEDNTFYFPDRIYNLKYNESLKNIRNFRDGEKFLTNTCSYKEKRICDPFKAFRVRNPMSGCVAFTKKTFLKSGGLDKNYIGWGYPDADYLMNIYKMGLNLCPINCYDIHIKHEYASGELEYRLMNLFNAVRYCKKWNIEINDKIKKLSSELNVTIEKVNRYDDIKKFISDNTKKIKLL